jgi:glycosyltransferase involved in cell wall biosynthesis
VQIVHIIKIVLTAGAERHLLRLLPGLKARGLDVHLIVLVQPDKPMDDFVALAADAGISVERIKIHRHADVTLLPRLARRLRQLRPDVVHTHLIHADLYGVLAARLVGVPTVVMSRHNDNAFRYYPMARLLNRMLWGLVSGGIAISEALREFCISVEGASPNKVVTIHYGLDRPQTDMSAVHSNLRRELTLPDNALLLGTVSRLIEQKGLHYLIHAMQQLHIDYAKLYLIITGDGVLRHDLEAQVAAAKLQERVRFLGWRDDAGEVMAGLDVFLQPSLWEGFGLVLLEAMAHELPIIATHVSAIPEIVQDGKTGLLVPPKDADALASAVRRLVDDPELRRQMGAAGHARLGSHFSEAKMMDATVAFYQTLTP